MKTNLIIITILLTLSAPARMTGAAELIVVEQAGCSWCEEWDADIGVIYANTPQGRIAPLRRIDIHERRPADLQFIQGVRGTPTFVLVHEGREFGRIPGYPGAHNFWGFLQRLLARLPANASQPALKEWSNALPARKAARPKRVIAKRSPRQTRNGPQPIIQLGR